MKNDAWIKAPALNKARQGHSNCLLGNSLYVYGGSRDSTDLPVERLKNISDSQGIAFGSWETLQINSPRDAMFVLMVPQVRSETILILGRITDNFGRP